MKELNMLHSTKYADAMEVAKKFVSKNDFRIMLKFIQHKADGTIVATDGHRLIQVKNIHGFEQEYLVNPRSLEFAKGNFPETAHLIPTEIETVFELNSENIKIWLQMHRSMNQMAKASKVSNDITIHMDKKGFEFEIPGSNITFNLPCENYTLGKQSRISYSIEYMRDALEAHQKLGTENLYFNISGQMKPMILDNGEDVQAVVLPIRRA